MLFGAVSFIVYSWNEPTTAMPSSYTIPLNTGTTAQTKSGDLSFTSFIDANDSRYYVNPSGDSKVSGGVTSDLSIENIDVSDSKTLVTKEYVDREIAKVETIVTGALPLVHSDHTQKDCVDAGGIPVDGSTELKQCKFIASVCPTNWTKNENWTATEATTVAYGDVYYDRYVSCTTPYHSFSNKAPEWARFEGDVTLLSPCYAFTHGKCYDSEVGLVGTVGFIPSEPKYCSKTVTGYANIIEVGCY